MVVVVVRVMMHSSLLLVHVLLLQERLDQLALDGGVLANHPAPDVREESGASGDGLGRGSRDGCLLWWRGRKGKLLRSGCGSGRSRHRSGSKVVDGSLLLLQELLVLVVVVEGRRGDGVDTKHGGVLGLVEDRDGRQALLLDLDLGLDGLDLLHLLELLLN